MKKYLFAAVILIGLLIYYFFPKSPETEFLSGTNETVCKTINFEETPFTHCQASRGLHEIAIIVDGRSGMPLRSFPALERELEKKALDVSFAVNGGMFDDEGNPIGLMVNEKSLVHSLNVNVGPGNFHMMPNGVFYGDNDGWHVTATEKFQQNGDDMPIFATQSGPMLLIDGNMHPKFSKNGKSLKIRNGVGVDSAGNAHFVISDVPVSFGRMARVYAELGVENALFLDGTVSALWQPEIGYVRGNYPLGPMIVVSRK